jgi:hypothetical protein
MPEQRRGRMEITEIYEFPLIKDRDFFIEQLRYCGLFRQKDEVIDSTHVKVYFHILNSNIKHKTLDVIRAIAWHFGGKPII